MNGWLNDAKREMWKYLNERVHLTGLTPNPSKDKGASVCVDDEEGEEEEDDEDEPVSLAASSAFWMACCTRTAIASGNRKSNCSCWWAEGWDIERDSQAAQIAVQLYDDNCCCLLLLPLLSTCYLHGSFSRRRTDGRTDGRTGGTTKYLLNKMTIIITPPKYL